MLRGLPHSFEETAVLLSFSQHIKDPCFFISLYVQVSCYEVEQRRTQKQSSPGVFVNILRLTCLQFGMCIYFFSAGLWAPFQTTTVTTSFRKHVVDLSFFLYAWTDLNTWIQFSLFIQLALCFTLHCFIYGSHVLWLQLRGEVPKTFSQAKHVLDCVYLTCILTENILTFHCRKCTDVIKWMMAELNLAASVLVFMLSLSHHHGLLRNLNSHCQCY